MKRFLQGDERAFISIYDRYWYKLFLCAYRRIKDKGAAEGLVQDLFVKLWERRGMVKIDRLEHYLFSSVRNATIDFLKKRMAAGQYLDYQKIFGALHSRTTEETVAVNDLEEALEKGLRALSGKSERVFRLYRIDHWSVEKIAGHLRLSEKTVHYHLTRSVKVIRTYLREFTLFLTILAILA